MKKNIQKISLLFVLFVFSTVVTLAGEDQCTIVPTPTPPGFVEIIETDVETIPQTNSETTTQTDGTSKLPVFIQEVIDTLSILF